MKNFLLIALLIISVNVKAQWTKTNFPSGISNIQSIAVDGNNIFAGTISNGILVSTNAGSSWAVRNTGLTGTWVESVATIGSNIFADDYVYGVALSTNNGLNWTLTPIGITLIYDFAINGTTIYAGGIGGVWQSSNNGTSWNKVLTTPNILSLAISGSTIYAGTDSSNIYKSTDDGANWAPVNIGLPTTPQQVNSLSICGSNVYATVFGIGIYVSNNGGTSWTLNNGLLNLNNSLATDGTNVFSGGSTISFTSNNGTTWLSVNGGLPIGSAITSLTVSGGNIYAGVFDGSNNCSVWKCSISQLISSVGIIEKQKEPSFTIAPNPFNLQTEVFFSEEQVNTTIKITDQLGKEIKSFLFSGRQLVIEKAEMKTGIYFLHAIDYKKQISILKLVIE